MLFYSMQTGFDLIYSSISSLHCSHFLISSILDERHLSIDCNESSVRKRSTSLSLVTLNHPADATINATNVATNSVKNTKSLVIFIDKTFIEGVLLCPMGMATRCHQQYSKLCLVLVRRHCQHYYHGLTLCFPLLFPAPQE